MPPVLRDYRPVTAERLKNPEDDNWLMIRRTYDGWGFSPLTQITPATVARLRPAWVFSTAEARVHQAAPIVNGGVMFVTSPNNQVIAIDVKTGNLLWRYRRPRTPAMSVPHETNRGVALYGDKVYFAAGEAVLIALDARTGREVWTTVVADNASGYDTTLAPLVAGGVVMVGASGGEFGIRGFIAGFDVETGKERWRTYTVPAPGEPGSETWPTGDHWKTGGAPVWVTGNYDTETNLAYWGTGNGGPTIGDQRPGDNLYVTSVVALDVARDGYIWFLERTSGPIKFVEGKPFVYQNVFRSLDPVTGRPDVDPERKPMTGKRADFCPGVHGGKNWPPIAFSPRTRMIYIPANNNLCGSNMGTQPQYTPGRPFVGVGGSRPFIRPGADHVGEVQAWNVDTGQNVWTHEYKKSPNWGGMLATAGGLVFSGGTSDRKFHAFDAATGKLLWEFPMNSGALAPPSSFSVDGKQYVAVETGWGGDSRGMQATLNNLFPGEYPEAPEGGAVWVFALE
jgi:alcohol dehydrogenase (cytochrome c)